MELLLGGQTPVMRDALARLVKPADRISLAVSFLQVSGWELLRPLIARPAIRTARVLCDDKMGITNPEAVRRMLRAGIDVRAYSGLQVYHPKVYLAGQDRGAGQAMLGSANLSESALLTSVEAGVTFRDTGDVLSAWFDDLFHNHSAIFDYARLARMEIAFRKRVKGDLLVRRALPPAAANEQGQSLVDRIFSALGPYVAPLSFDQGKNNVRSMQKAWELVRSPSATWSVVQEAELRFAGLASGWALTQLGQSVSEAATLPSAVTRWATWLKLTPPAQLPQRKFDNLAVAQRAFAAFWRMRPNVRAFFLDRAVQNDAPDRPTLQAIELLANAGTVSEDLTLQDVQALAPLLTDPRRFTSNVAGAVETYIENKAARTWGYPERRWILEAWRDA